MKRFILAFLVTTAVFGMLFSTMEAYSQSFRFVDEEEHLVIGNLLTRGYSLYTDLSTNHQPLPYFLSALVQKTLHPQNLFMLVKRHREVVFLWSFLWAFLLLWRFSWKVLVPIVLFEGFKYFLLGNEFLAESFAAYPLAYAMSGLFGTKKWGLFEGAVLVIPPFFSLPLAVPASVLFTYTAIRHTFSGVLKVLLGAACVFVPVILLAHPFDYWRETVINNYEYAAPRLSTIHSFTDVLKAVFLPFLYWLEPDSLLVWVVRSVTFVLAACVGYLLFKRSWKKMGVWFVFITVWVLTNMRDSKAGLYYYSGFHLLPWFMVGLIGASFAFFSVLETLPKRWQFGGSVSFVFMAFLFLLLPHSPLLHHPEPQTEHYVQYNPIAQTTQVLSVIQQPGEHLMTVPAESITHWATGLLPATRQVTYYEWQYWPSKNRQAYAEMISAHPPEYIQFANDHSAYSASLTNLLDTQYSRLFTFYRNGEATGLYVRSDRLEQITTDQWQELVKLPLNIEHVPDTIHKAVE